MVNSVVLIGRLTKDPELRTTGSGTPVVSFTLAVNRRFKSQGQPEADFINCVAWNKTAETMARYLHKGSLIAITGRIETRNYENQQGQRVYVTEVVADSFDFLEPRTPQAHSRASMVRIPTARTVTAARTMAACRDRIMVPRMQARPVIQTIRAVTETTVLRPDTVRLPVSEAGARPTLMHRRQLTICPAGTAVTRPWT